MGYEEIDNSSSKLESEESTEDTPENPNGVITSSRDLNELIKQAMLNKEDDKKKKG